MINIKDFDPNIIRTNEKSYKNIFIYYTRYVTIKKDLKIYSVNPLYLIFDKVNGYYKEINGNKYLTLVPTNESKEKMKKYGKTWNKIRDLVKSVTKKANDYDEKKKKKVKIKFDLADNLPLNKTIRIIAVLLV